MEKKIVEADQVELEKVKAEEVQSPEELLLVISGLRSHQQFLERQNELLVSAAEKARSNQKQLQLFLESTYDVLFTMNDEGCFDFVSSAWERNFGFPVSEVTGKSFHQFVHQDDVLLFSEYLQQVLEGTYSRVSPAYRIKHADGSWNWNETNGMPYVDVGGTLMFTGASRDITERKQAMDTLIENEFFFKEAQRLASIGSYKTDFIAGYWEASEVMDTIFGIDNNYTHSIQGWLDIVHPDDRVMLEEYFREIIEKRKPFSKEYRIIRKNDGELRWVHGLGEFTFDGSGNAIYLIGTVHDITKQKKADEALRKSNSRFNQLAEQSSTIVWEIDTMGLFTYVSHVSEAVLGYLPEELVGRVHFCNLHPEKGRDTFRETIFGFINRKEQFHNLEHCEQTKDGSLMWLTSDGLPILNADGTLLGYRGICSDITERRKLKDQLHQSQKMEAVGQLASGLAHDFNNVLSVINGYCCLLGMEAEQDEKRKNYVEQIQAASGRAAELTKGMLAFSRTQVMNQQNHNLNSVVSNIGSFVKRIIREDIHLQIITNDVLLPVYIDSGQIEQLLINLVTNARDAMPQGGQLTIVTDRLTMDASFIAAHGYGEPGLYASITVSDNGKGMNEATKSKIFEPFFTTKEVGKGTGLGLAMVYGITKQHNGFVDVVSEPDQGASFQIYLPLFEPENRDTDVDNAVVVETLTGRETLLLVEDDEDLRGLMNTMLMILGYKVILAGDGQEAVDAFRDNSDEIKLVIMDMVMPRKNGKQAYDEIRRIKPDTRALFSSGYSAKIVQRQGELGENAEFISKPVQPAVLSKKVREMLDRV